MQKKYSGNKIVKKYRLLPVFFLVFLISFYVFHMKLTDIINPSPVLDGVNS